MGTGKFWIVLVRVQKVKLTHPTSHRLRPRLLRFLHRHRRLRRRAQERAMGLPRHRRLRLLPCRRFLSGDYSGGDRSVPICGCLSRCDGLTSHFNNQTRTWPNKLSSRMSATTMRSLSGSSTPYSTPLGPSSVILGRKVSFRTIIPDPDPPSAPYPSPPALPPRSKLPSPQSPSPATSSTTSRRSALARTAHSARTSWPPRRAASRWAASRARCS